MDALEPAGTAQAQLKTLLLLDLVDSTGMIERLGDLHGAELMRRHDRLVRDLIKVHGGREIDKTDGFLIVFERPVQAAAFALIYQRALKDNPELPLQARVGLHVGEVVLFENSAEDIEAGAKRIDVEGLAKPIAARLMSLARPGQILASDLACSLVQRASSELQQRFPQACWRDHGRYRLKGVSGPLAVHEIGEPGVAPLQRPVDVQKAQRQARIGRWLVSLLGTGAVLGGLVWLLLFAQPSLAFQPRDWLVLGSLVNQSGDASLTEPLEFALRQSLEQSRFANVVPELQIRGALRRMERDEAGTTIDRQVGSEIAVREHAQALILPSVVPLGRQLRLGLELVEPATTRTVVAYEEVIDGPEQLLEGLDRLTARLRQGLGESLAQVQSDSLPLERLTTGNLDALRAHAVAMQVMQGGELDKALLLLDRAIALDPGFASAHARKGMLLLSLERPEEARAAWALARQHGERLSEREQLYIDAQFAQWSSAQEAVERWEIYAELYPDLVTGQNNAAIDIYTMLNDPARAEQPFTEVVQSNHPLRRLAQHSLGLVHLAQGEMAEAELAFREAVPIYFGMAAWLTAGGRHAEAQRYLATAAPMSVQAEQERHLRLVTLDLDRGAYAEAVRRAGDARQSAVRSGFAPQSRTAAAALAALLAAGDQAGARALAASQLDTLLALPGEPDPQRALHLLFWAGQALALGQREAPAAALALPAVASLAQGFPVVGQLQDVALAELDLAAGRPAEASARLQRWLGRNELWAVRYALARAADALQNWTVAAEHWRWLRQRPGLAQAEWIDQMLGQQQRVLEWHEAGACLGRALLAAGDAAAAVQAWQQYQARAATPPPARVAATVQALQPLLRPGQPIAAQVVGRACVATAP